MVTMADLSTKQRAFVEEYLTCWNATEAARRTGYKHPNKQGPRLLVNIGIQAAIQARLSDKAMKADEVLARLSAHARGSMEDFLMPESLAVDLVEAQKRGQLHLIKKIEYVTRTDGEDSQIETTKIELYDAQAALVHLGRHHGLFSDRVEHTGKDGGPIELEHRVDPEQFNRALTTLADALRDVVSLPAPEGSSAVDATE